MSVYCVAHTVHGYVPVYEDQSSAIYLAWEDGNTIFLQIIPLEELN